MNLGSGKEGVLIIFEGQKEESAEFDLRIVYEPSTKSHIINIPHLRMG